MDLLTPTDHAGAYEWAAVFCAHFAIGLALAALAAAILDLIDHLSGFDIPVADTAPALVTFGYLVIWEMGLQRIGAGWGDALIDTLAIGLGAAYGLYLWRRDGKRLALALVVACVALWHGTRGRK